jgi:tetratricopeptide (TPR) repeat protein
MSVRLVISPILVLFSCCLLGQQISRGGDDTGPPASSAANDGPALRQKIFDRIVVLEAATRQAESANAGDLKLGRLYSQLGLFYENAAQWDRSEAALKRAVALFRHANEANGELAVALTQLGSMHVTIGKLRDGEREEQEALKLREVLNDRLQIARSWMDLAALSIAENKFGRAKDFAQKAVAELAGNERALPFDRIAARYALALALCLTGQCSSAIPLLKGAMDEAKADKQFGDIPICFGKFLLGYAYWKSGDMMDAGPYMQEGTVRMGELLGPGHPSYLAALKHYARYLREAKNVEAADVVERKIRQAEAVVDVHSLQTSQGTFGIVGLR